MPITFDTSDAMLPKEHPCVVCKKPTRSWCGYCGEKTVALCTTGTCRVAHAQELPTTHPVETFQQPRKLPTR